MESDSYNQQQLEDLLFEVLEAEAGDAKTIQHLIKVHSFAKIIGVGEGMDDASLQTLEAASYLHNIGVKPAEEKYGSSSGELQEQEGPILAQGILSELGFDNYIIERVCYLIGHHRTFESIDGDDFQAFVEAEYLTIAYEKDYDREELADVYHRYFRTETGKRLFRQIYGITEE